MDTNGSLWACNFGIGASLGRGARGSQPMLRPVAFGGGNEWNERMAVPVLRLLVLALVALALLLLAPTSAGADFTGRATVIDGDTIDIHGQRIRLFGIDAPESGQECRLSDRTYACGVIAAGALKDLTAGIEVRCEEEDVDRYGRIVATCYDDHGFDINRNMVYTGWALAYREYSSRYIEVEEGARKAQRGLWRGEFVPPWEWRKGQRLEATVEETDDCRIKGNISSNGDRIYHIPGGRFYDRTRIDPAKGERWFCSEAEAEAAGWRRSRQ